ncbi:MAG: dTDP-4-dehydrorhamnose reductase [candidate division NC10 bacterium]
MKILVTGARGMLGSDLVPILQDEGHEVLAWDLEELDITRREDVFAALETERPQTVINCAAYTNVDGAETERETAYAVNALGVQNIALACAKIDCELMQISTDYVFDGTKRTPYLPLDQPNPINWYGYTKYAGEKFAEWHCSRFYIVRTSWLYGKHGKNFVQTILRLAKERDHLEVVDDQVGAPTHTKSLSRFLANLIGTGRFGIHHFTDDTGQGISWFEFAQEIVKQVGLPTMVRHIKTKQMPRPAKRPSYSTLAILTNPLVDWKAELHKYLKC